MEWISREEFMTHFPRQYRLFLEEESSPDTVGTASDFFVRDGRPGFWVDAEGMDVPNIWFPELDSFGEDDEYPEEED